MINLERWCVRFLAGCVAGTAVFTGAGAAMAAGPAVVHSIDKVEVSSQYRDVAKVTVSYTCAADSGAKFVWLIVTNGGEKEAEDFFAAANCDGTKHSVVIPTEHVSMVKGEVHMIASLSVADNRYDGTVGNDADLDY
ncbi:hypothetical protein [Nocardia sp. NBC_01388]|uniref:hypothetical protein n=1 Tax=Nocardia sp. NBC_01388 TaxID=2903596 RepID=UPI0032506CE9